MPDTDQIQYCLDRSNSPLATSSAEKPTLARKRRSTQSEEDDKILKTLADREKRSPPNHFMAFGTYVGAYLNTLHPEIAEQRMRKMSRAMYGEI